RSPRWVGIRIRLRPPGFSLRGPYYPSPCFPRLSKLDGSPSHIWRPLSLPPFCQGLQGENTFCPVRRVIRIPEENPAWRLWKRRVCRKRAQGASSQIESLVPGLSRKEHAPSVPGGANGDRGLEDLAQANVRGLGIEAVVEKQRGPLSGVLVGNPGGSVVQPPEKEVLAVGIGQADFQQGFVGLALG